MNPNTFKCAPRQKKQGLFSPLLTHIYTYSSQEMDFYFISLQLSKLIKILYKQENTDVFTKHFVTDKMR